MDLSNDNVVRFEDPHSGSDVSVWWKPVFDHDHKEPKGLVIDGIFSRPKNWYLLIVHACILQVRACVRAHTWTHRIMRCLFQADAPLLQFWSRLHERAYPLSCCRDSLSASGAIGSELPWTPVVSEAPKFGENAASPFAWWRATLRGMAQVHSADRLSASQQMHASP